MSGTAYLPPAGEYVRPAGSVRLEPVNGVDNHFVRGVWFHQEALQRFRAGQEMELELVPEPGNPWDRWAVAVHAREVRIGYVAAADSGRWHDVVVACNRRGLAVYAAGLIRETADLMAATVRLLSRYDSEILMDEAGLFEECRQLVDLLPEEARTRIISGHASMPDDDVRLLRSNAALAPGLNWEVGTGSSIDDRFPTALCCYLRRRDKEERAQRRVAAAEQRRADKEARRKRNREEWRNRAPSGTKPAAPSRQGASDEAFATEVVEMFRAGESRAAIASRFGCSLGRVAGALVEAGYTSAVPGVATPRMPT